MSKQEPGAYNYPQQQQPLGATAPPGHAAVTYVPPSAHPQQQHQQLVIAPAAPVVVAQPRARQSFVLHIVLSCFVVWLCFCLFGCVAFILALIAQSRADAEPESARQMGKASLGLSITGIVIGVIIIIIMIVLSVAGVAVFTAATVEALGDCQYVVNGNCYKSRSFTDSCYDGYFKDGYCYHND